MITVDGFYDLLKLKKFDKILLNHGMYVPQGLSLRLPEKKKYNL